MAIDYSLDLETTATAEEVAREFLRVAGDLGLPAEGFTTEILTAEGGSLGAWAHVCVHRREPNPGPGAPVTEDFGIVPTVAVGIRLGKETDACVQVDDLIRLAGGLLERVEGDAVLDSSLEQIWLVRRDGVLILSDDPQLWSREQLAAFPKPDRREPLQYSQDTDSTGRIGAELRREVQRRHEVLGRWLAGSPVAFLTRLLGNRPTDPALEDVLAPLDPRFRLIGVDGRVRTHSDVRSALAEAGGHHPGLEIRIGQVEIVADHDGVGVVRYVEQHHTGSTRYYRWTTAVLCRDDDPDDAGHPDHAGGTGRTGRTGHAQQTGHTGRTGHAQQTGHSGPGYRWLMVHETAARGGGQDVRHAEDPTVITPDHGGSIWC